VVEETARGAGRSRPGAGGWLLIAIAIAYATLLLLGPLCAIVWSAFSNGLLVFAERITSPDALRALELTFLLAAGATAINLVFGLAIAHALVRDRFRGQRLLNALVDVPFAVSPVITGFLVVLLFGRGGWLRPLAEGLGIQFVFALPGMLLVTTFVSLPFVVREVMPVLAHLGVEQEQAASTLGANAWQVFWRVTLPGIREALFYGVSLTFARAIGEFGAVLVVSGSISGQTETATLFLFGALDERDTAGANAMAFVLAAASLSLLLGIRALQKRRAGH
jgi:sulfate transport system permease protein